MLVLLKQTINESLLEQMLPHQAPGMCEHYVRHMNRTCLVVDTDTNVIHTPTS